MTNKIIAFFRRPQVWGFLISVAVLAVISLAFFYPDNFQGNSLRQPDMQQGAANGHEGLLFEQATGEKALWTNSLFGGMPTFQISPSYPSNSLFTWINTAYGLGLPAPSNLLFMMMFGFLILMFALRKRWYYALIGAIAWGFSSYFIIIIGAGHIWKFLALAYVPPTIAGLILLYRHRYITGGAMMALFATMQLNANHPQMSYYFGLVMALIVLAYLVEAIRKHRLRSWLTASAVALAAGVLALGANAPSLYNTYEYARHTKRAQSELEEPAAAGTQSEARPTGGLSKDEIVFWSYSPSELFSLVVPNIKGGSTGRPAGGVTVATNLADLDEAAQYTANTGTYYVLMSLPQYFNGTEGTNGPVYAGAVVVALFLLGCFIVRGPLKWAMVAATVMSLLLSLGYNFDALSDWMIYHFPLYNKFRAVESILVVAEFAIPLLGALALAEFFEAGKEAWARYRKPFCLSFGAVGAVALLAAMWPTLFGELTAASDLRALENLQQQIAQIYQQQGATQQEITDAVYEFSLSNPANFEAVTQLRAGMVRTDGLRSFLFCGLAFLAMYFFGCGRMKRGIAIAFVGVLITVDLYGADKRYVNHDSFAPAVDLTAQGIEADAIDNAIMADTDGHYRVLDIPDFGSARRSYFHKMLGGYHAAKLNRYEDIINHKLMPVLRYGYTTSPSAPAVLRDGAAVVDMLNARYIITGDPQRPLLYNSNAMGNAWFIDSIAYVDGARDEMDALDADSYDFRRQAVADRTFADILGYAIPAADGDTLYLTEYTPNTLSYHASTRNGGIGVFSEVYFPWGWHAYIDDTEVPLGRVNYILRALRIPAGEHNITMTFAPESVKTSSALAYACITLIYMLVASAIFIGFRRWRIF